MIEGGAEGAGASASRGEGRVKEAHENRAVFSQAEEPEARDGLLAAMLLNRLADRVVVVALAGRRRVQQGLERVVAAGGSVRPKVSPYPDASKRQNKTHLVTQTGEWAMRSKASPSMSIATVEKHTLVRLSRRSAEKRSGGTHRQEPRMPPWPPPRCSFRLRAQTGPRG